MSIITRGNFLKISFSTLAGIALANLIACFNKSSIANIIKNPVASSQSSSSQESSSSKDSSKETQPQNETTNTTASSRKGKIEKKTVVGIASGESLQNFNW